MLYRIIANVISFVLCSRVAVFCESWLPIEFHWKSNFDSKWLTMHVEQIKLILNMRSAAVHCVGATCRPTVSRTLYTKHHPFQQSHFMRPFVTGVCIMYGVCCIPRTDADKRTCSSTTRSRTCTLRSADIGLDKYVNELLYAMNAFGNRDRE